jgi:uncharacterized protein
MNRTIPRLIEWFRDAGDAAVCFSGGLDSTVLLGNAVCSIPDRCVAVFVDVPMLSERQRLIARELIDVIGARAVTVRLDWTDIPGLESNGTDRCYLCKKAIYSSVREIADDLGIVNIVAGENIDDDADDRPGRRAGSEIGVRYPFVDTAIGRTEIEDSVSEMDLPFPMIKDTCMATRFGYGTHLDSEKVRIAAQCENDIREATGVGLIRVRFRDDTATVVAYPNEIDLLKRNEGDISRILGSAGIRRTIIDPNGYGHENGTRDG